MELRRRRRTYREILHILRERCGLQISLAALHKYIRRQRKAGSAVRAAAGTRQPEPQREEPSGDEPVSPPKAPASAKSREEVWQRIAALKRRRPEPEPEEPVFRYAPDKPLTLVDGK
jgi:hypothetical protein